MRKRSRGHNGGASESIRTSLRTSCALVTLRSMGTYAQPEVRIPAEYARAHVMQAPGPPLERATGESARWAENHSHTSVCLKRTESTAVLPCVTTKNSYKTSKAAEMVGIRMPWAMGKRDAAAPEYTRDPLDVQTTRGWIWVVRFYRAK